MRVRPKSLADYPWYVRALFWSQRRKYGAVLDPALLWGRSPRVFLALALMFGALERRSSPLRPQLRSLIIVRVSQVNGCPFCVDINSATALDRGAAVDKLDALESWPSSALFDDAERAALAYAEAMTRTDRRVDDAIWADVRRHFDDDAVVELTALVAFQNMSSKFNSALAVPPQGFCRRPGPGSWREAPAGT